MVLYQLLGVHTTTFKLPEHRVVCIRGTEDYVFSAESNHSQLVMLVI